MKRTIYMVWMLALLALAAPAWAQLSVTKISETNTIKTEEPAWSDGDWFDPALERPMSWPQADSVEYDLWARHSTSEWVNLDYTNLVIAWSIVSATNHLQAYLVATGEVVTATNGHVQFALTPEQSNLRTGRYWSAVAVRQVIGGTNRYIGTLSERALTVRYSAEGANWSYVGASQLDTYLTSGKVAIVGGSLSNNPGVPGGITIVIPTVGGASTNVSFENLELSGDVGTATNQLARGSDAAAAAAVANAATVAVAVAQSTANAATVSVAALNQIVGKWSTNFAIFGVTNPSPCGLYITRGTTDLHSVTGCVSWVTWSNPPAGGGESIPGPYASPASNNTYDVGTTQTMYIVKFTEGFILGNVLVTNVSTNAGSSAYTNTFTGQGTTGAVTSTSSDTGKFLNAVGQMVTPGYPTGVGGGTNGLVLIASYVADDTTNRFVFSDIPQIYRSLMLIGGLWERGEATWDSGNINGAPVGLRPNNNTNAVYDWNRTLISGSARTDGVLNNYTYIYAAYGTSTTNGWCSFRTRLDNYTLVGAAKAIDSEWTSAQYEGPPAMKHYSGEFRGGVRDMNAITSIVGYAISGTNWNRGRVDLYGVQ